MRLKWVLKVLFILGTLSILLMSCYPDGGLESIADYDVVITRYNEAYDFGAVKTYAMPDTILHVLADSSAKDEISREFDDLILETIAENMEQIGYRRITDTSQQDSIPDVIMLAGVFATTYQGWSYWPGWGGGWGYWPGWGWWGPGYPGYGPGYPGVGVPYTFSTGTVVAFMFEPDDFDPDIGLLPSEWGFGINGLLGSSSSGTASRIGESIDQAFNQSPYLGAR
jgi:hypothetical protein